jgi:SNF2 family DNA or RNA helicase
MLVICPLKPAYNVWPKQKDKWDEFKHLRVCVLHGKDKEELLQSNNYDIYVVNPEGLPWLFGADNKHSPLPSRKKLIKDKFDVLCVDESTKFKDTSTGRFKLLRKIVPVFKRRYILTGTLNPTGLEDIFGQVFILDEGASLGQYITNYRGRYFHTQPWDKYTMIPNLGAFEEVCAKIADLVLRISRKEIPDLPNLIIDDRYVDLPAPAMQLYLATERDLLIRLDTRQIVAANAAVASSKCRQIANGFVYDENRVGQVVHDEKMKELKSLIEDLQGEPLVVTYEFQEDRDAMLRELKAPCISTGNAKRDDETIERFRRGAYPVVIGSTASISLGIDGLQDVCGHMAMFGVTWKLIDYLQVIDRIRRQGSNHSSVVLHRILARGTVDERVVQRLDEREGEMIDFMELLQSMRGR